ncbi:hypothetical protein KI387_017584, partial [Taxus chinensis]
MEKVNCSRSFHINMIEKVVVPPSMPSTKTTLHLSTLDNLVGRRFANVLLVYNASHTVSADPVKVIRQALSKVLVYYPSFAGRLRNKENGELEVECTGEGALFVEAMVDDDLSVIGDLDDHNPSFKQLIFSLPLDTDIQDLHLLIVQVTRFTCGGFVVGTSFHHTQCDGIGVGQFLQGMADMARGAMKPSLKPIWNRELVNAEDIMYLLFYQYNFIDTPLSVEKCVQAPFFINLNTIKYIKRYIMQECKEHFSTCEILAALVWVARTRTYQIPHSENVNLLFAVNMRRSFNPPLPKEYYGNAFGEAHAMDNVEDLLSGSLLRAAMIIKKSNISLKENFRSRTVTKPCALDVAMNPENVIGFGDWRVLGFYEVDFGWGDAVNVSPMQQAREHE